MWPRTTPRSASRISNAVSLSRAPLAFAALSASERLTPEQVHNVAFSKPPLFKRGYNEDEVDAFLDRVESTLRDRDAFGGLTAADLHNVAFSKPPIGKRGYNEDEVDAFVELVKIELSRR